MYAKLVAGVGISASNMIRDIVRICTSNAPSTSELGAFDSTLSVIIDDTPAGWSYVYSSVDTNTLAGTGASIVTGTQDWWAMSAPCLGPSETTVKYAKFTLPGTGALTTTSTETENAGFIITSAESITGSTVVNEGYRGYTSSATYDDFADQTIMDLRGTGVYHVIATPRQITVMKEGMAYYGIWETTIPDVYRFNNTTPAITVWQSITPGSLTGAYDAATGGIGASSPNIAINPGIYTTTGTTYWASQFAVIHNVYDSNTSTIYGSIGLLPETEAAMNPYLFQRVSRRGITVDANGATKNIVSPIFFHAMQVGIPTVFVTGVSDIYYTKGGIGTIGDIVTIDGVDYTYFPLYRDSVTAANAPYTTGGLLMLTS